MDKVNDTLTFTTAANQEKTPQQTMAEEATQQQAELAARIERQALVQQTAAPASPLPNGSPSQPLPQSAPDNDTAVAAGNATSAGTAPQPVVAAGSQAPAPANGGSGSGSAVAQQAVGIEKGQSSKTPSGVDSVNNAAAASTNAQVAAPRAGLTGDQINNLLGFSSAPPTTGSASASPATTDAGMKVAAKAAVAPSTKSGAPPDNRNSHAAKSAPTDPATAKTLLNFR
jgi:hypothetical protein